MFGALAASSSTSMSPLSVWMRTRTGLGFGSSAARTADIVTDSRMPEESWHFDLRVSGTI